MNDYDIAQKYVSKTQYAYINGIAFELSFTAFKNMMRAKRCQYTGILFTESEGKQRATDRSIDRIDCSKGYIKGNVVVVCNAANQFKSLFENPEYAIKPKMARKILGVLDKVEKSKEENMTNVEGITVSTVENQMK